MKNKYQHQSRVVQMVPVYLKNDGVGNCVGGLAKLLTKLGYENIIVAINKPDFKVKNYVPFHKYEEREKDIIIYHLSTGNFMNHQLKKFVSPKIAYYNNITPKKYFYDDIPLYLACESGRNDLLIMRNQFFLSLAPSYYNLSELEKIGGYGRLILAPLFTKLDDLKNATPTESILKKYDDGVTNILFVGRIVRNKKFEDLIHTFYYYNKYINPNSRLMLVGKHSSEAYFNYLDNLIKENNLKNIHFLNANGVEDLAAYYKAADLFLCESEHEGFCIPLLEAMLFDLPIIALDRAAIKSTLNGAGVLVTKKDAKFLAELINLILSNAQLKNEIIAKEKERLNDFSLETIEKFYEDLFIKYIP